MIIDIENKLTYSYQREEIVAWLIENIGRNHHGNDGPEYAVNVECKTWHWIFSGRNSYANKIYIANDIDATLFKLKFGL